MGILLVDSSWDSNNFNSSSNHHSIQSWFYFFLPSSKCSYYYEHKLNLHDLLFSQFHNRTLFFGLRQSEPCLGELGDLDFKVTEYLTLYFIIIIFFLSHGSFNISLFVLLMLMMMIMKVFVISHCDKHIFPKSILNCITWNLPFMP